MPRIQRFPSLLALALFLLAGCQAAELPPQATPPSPLGSAITAYKPQPRQRAYWPTQGWQSRSPKDAQIDAKALEAVEKYLFTRTGDAKNRKGIRTDGIAIIKDGYLVYEKYARGYDKDRPHLAWSASKSFVNALYGIAARKGLLKLDDPAAKYYKKLDRPHHREITLRHLLQMTPGLFWREGYEASFFDSSVLAMLYSEGRDDMAAFAAKQRMAYKAGDFWYYSSGTSNLAVGVLRETLKGQDLNAFIWSELFERIGMKRVTWQRDGAGNVVGSSYLYASPRQLAKFGYLYLNDGLWDGQRILPEGWVTFTATTPPADPIGEYGAHWWLNTGRPEKKIKPRFPSAPRDLLRASGHWGQRIYVFPSHDLVIALLSDNRDDTFNEDRFLSLVMAMLPPSPKGDPAAPTLQASPKDAPAVRPTVQPAVQKP
jgi:CubicO group peptidase (beta-lactamase class C family)